MDIELISPADWVKQQVKSVQDYTLIASRSLGNLFSGVEPHQYWSTAYQILVFQDVFMGLAKPILFGFIIATVGCYYGMSTRGGTQGVGRATTQAVVASSILIIAVDFFVTRLSMTLFGG